VKSILGSRRMENASHWEIARLMTMVPSSYRADSRNDSLKLVTDDATGTSLIEREIRIDHSVR